MNLELQGRTAVVTGGSRGIGRAVAAELAAAGVAVAIAARGREPLEQAATQLGGSFAPPQGHGGARGHH